MSEQVTVTKRGRGRPRLDEARTEQVSSTRPPRVPVSGNRDILTVTGKDPDYVYRWVIDSDERGQRILKFLGAWYEFVRSDDGNHVVGQDAVYKSENVGSIIRVPAGSGKYQYLMRIRKEYYDADQKSKQDEIRDREKAITRTDSDNGQYGKIELSRD